MSNNPTQLFQKLSTVYENVKSDNVKLPGIQSAKPTYLHQVKCENIKDNYNICEFVEKSVNHNVKNHYEFLEITIKEKVFEVLFSCVATLNFELNSAICDITERCYPVIINNMAVGAGGFTEFSGEASVVKYNYNSDCFLF